MIAPLLLAVVVAQTPMPVAAINAAKTARADVETAQKKNAAALNPQAPSTASGQAAPPQQPQAHPAAPAAPPGASAPAAPPSAAQLPSQQAADGVYTYDGQGRRDPFVSLLNRGDVMRPNGAIRPAGLQGLMVNEIVVKGILKTTTGFIAVIQGADNRGYIVKQGDRLLDGSIKSIAQDAVVFSEDVNDPLSTVKQREVRKPIRSDAR